MKFFNELIETIMNKSRAGFGLSNRTSVSVSNNPKEMITSVMTAVGEVSSIAYADPVSYTHLTLPTIWSV